MIHRSLRGTYPGGAVGTSGQVCFACHRGNLEPTMTNNRLFAVELISDSYRDTAEYFMRILVESS